MVPLHWLDRFFGALPPPLGIEISRAELDPAFDAATQDWLRSHENRESLRDSPDLVAISNRPSSPRTYSKADRPISARYWRRGGAKGRHRIVEAITTSFVLSDNGRIGKHSREVMAALNSPIQARRGFEFLWESRSRFSADARLERFFAAVRRFVTARNLQA